MSKWLQAVLIALVAAAAVALAVPRSSPASAGRFGDRWWSTYGGSFANARNADLERIGPSTVGSLKLAWSFATGVSGQLETSPVAVDGTLYVTTGADNGVFALDASTGRQKWHFIPRVGHAHYVFAVNRGVAAAGGRVFFATLDDQLIALDERTGAPVWQTAVGDPRDGLTECAAPLAWNGLVFIGSSGGELGIRGSYTAYRQRDGKRVWRWWTVSPGWEGTYQSTAHGFALHRDVAREKAAAARYRDAWQHGGGAVWMTPALDPETATIFLSTGNPAPAFNGGRRPGDNLYTDSIVALDAHTGRMKWYFQQTPHDVWDYDAASPPVLIDTLDVGGRRVPAVAEAGKNGFLYVLDRITGRLIRATAFIPQPNLYRALSVAPQPVQPGDGGGAIGPIAYDRLRHAVYVAGNVLPEVGQTAVAPAWRADSDAWTGGTMQEATGVHESALLSRIDTDSGQVAWQTPIGEAVFGGPLSTTTGLVFVGEQTTGAFKAYASDTGKPVWKVRPGDLLPAHGVHEFFLQLLSTVRRLRHPDWVADGDIHAPAIAYRMNGREYVVVASNVFATRAHRGGDTVFAFALP